MTIHVTQEDIDAGVRWSCYECPVANALSRSTGMFASVAPHFGIELFCADKKLHWKSDYRCRLPRSVVEFMSEFDARQPVSPFSFEIDYKGGE